MKRKKVTRRDFVADAAKFAAGAMLAPKGFPMIVPRHVLGGPGYRAPSDTLNFASIGIGGMGMNNLSELLKAGEHCAAICDVDFPYVERSLNGRLRPGRDGQVSPDADRLKDAYTKANKYADFREMLDKEKSIDAIVVATPDHMHAIIANTAMKMGKHAYVQKPLTYSVLEARTLAKTAKDMKVVTQMGNQGHSREGTHRIAEIVASGVLGPIREVHVYTDRPQRYWAQGIPSPTQMAALQPQAGSSSSAAAPSTVPPSWNIRTVERAVLKEMASNPLTPPDGLHWDLFLGGAPDLPYHPVYHPFSWRGWVPFGVSAIGDMGAHLIDQPYLALGLGLPTSIVSTSTPWGGPARNPASYPTAMTTRYEFAARGNQPPVMLQWYDGGLTPMVMGDYPLPGGDGGGGIFVGERGLLTYETYGDNPQVYPAAIAAEAQQVPKTLPRIDVPHEVNWANACKGQGQASSPFEYAARLTETMLLGIVALRAGQAKRITYDADAMTCTNVPDVNQWLTREYRSGWSL